MKNQALKKCESKTKRKGTPCQNPAGFRTDHLGEGRCYLHGGNVKGGPPENKKAVTFGIYGDCLFEEEKKIWHKIEIKTLDDQIRLVSLQLLRAMKAQKHYLRVKEEVEKVGDDLELQELMIEAGMGPMGPVNVKRIIKRKRDFTYEIDRLSGRLGDLISKNAQLKGDEMNAKERARLIKTALEEIEKNADGID